MRVIITIAFLSTIIGCNKSDSDSDVANRRNSNNTQQKEAVNVTDYGICSQGQPSHSLEGKWQQHFRSSSDFSFTMTLEIVNGLVQMTNDCYFQGRSLSASVSSPAVYNSEDFQILHNAKDESHINEPNFKMNCDVSVQPYKMKYKFRGQCLVFYAPGQKEELALIPARY